MKTSPLLPHRFKAIGWLLFIPCSLLGIAIITTDYRPDFLNVYLPNLLTKLNGSILANNQVNLANTVVGALLIIGGLLLVLSKEKQEDEYIAELRLNALLWAVVVNYLLLLAAFLLVYDFNFLEVMIYNMFTILFIFILRFEYLLYQAKKSNP